VITDGIEALPALRTETTEPRVEPVGAHPLHLSGAASPKSASDGQDRQEHLLEAIHAELKTLNDQKREELAALRREVSSLTASLAMLNESVARLRIESAQLQATLDNANHKDFMNPLLVSNLPSILYTNIELPFLTFRYVDPSRILCRLQEARVTSEISFGCSYILFKQKT
jgi:hypothetical protein